MIRELHALSIICIWIVCIPLLFCKSQSKDAVVSDKIVLAKKILVDSIISNDTLNYITGRFDPTQDSLFKEIPIKMASRTGMFLRIEALVAFEKMSATALKEGIRLQIISATRNFDSQKIIWENKWTGKTLVEDGKNLSLLPWSDQNKALKILEYSSMPSTSRHHWGTDIDINSLSNAFFEQGVGKKLYDWLCTHAASYGFCQPYTSGRTEGYKQEKWHWTYMPISLELTEYVKKKFSNQLISGFMGSHTAMDIDVRDKYMLGINPACKN